MVQGINSWKERTAQVSYLKGESVSVPVVFLPSHAKSNKVFLIASGFHLEETSGPMLLLNPKLCLPIFRNILRDINITIFPVINQFGQSFNDDVEDNYLRYNAEGINYNTAWGFNKKKCKEVTLVEEKLIKFHLAYQIVFVLSLHEDSSEPGKGFLWMNNIPPAIRKSIQLSLKRQVDKDMLLKIASAVGLRKGRVESGFSVVDAKDESFENFTSEILGIPTLLSEAPFGLNLKRRIAFHQAALTSIPF